MANANFDPELVFNNKRIGFGIEYTNAGNWYLVGTIDEENFGMQYSI